MTMNNSESNTATAMSQRAWARRLGMDEARVRRVVAGEIGVDLGALLEGGKVGLAVLRQALAAAEAKVTGFAVHDATAKP
jgi:hypothetical protein